jgi:hypothetical protein
MKFLRHSTEHIKFNIYILKVRCTYYILFLLAARGGALLVAAPLRNTKEQESFFEFVFVIDIFSEAVDVCVCVLRLGQVFWFGRITLKLRYFYDSQQFLYCGCSQFI